MVKRIEGALIQAVDLARAGAGPRRVQVYQAIVDAILDGRLPAGSNRHSNLLIHGRFGGARPKGFCGSSCQSTVFPAR